MPSKISKWGHSLAVRIPARLAEQHNIEEGTEVDIYTEPGGIKISPRDHAAATLEQLLANVTPDNTPGEIDTGPAVGVEILE